MEEVDLVRIIPEILPAAMELESPGQALAGPSLTAGGADVAADGPAGSGPSGQGA
ncbi:Transposon Ty3-I Gag-Pol poly, partial [Clarias magur]